MLLCIVVYYLHTNIFEEGIGIVVVEFFLLSPFIADVCKRCCSLLFCPFINF